MSDDREKYEKMIRSSPLFSCDREKQPTAFRREAYKMVEYLYRCFLMGSEEEEYSCEFVETARRCIRNYDASKGEFLHYFNAAWRQERSHIRGRQAVETALHGIKVSEDDLRKFKNYKKFLGRFNASISKEELYRKIAAVSGLSLEEVKQADKLSQIKVSEPIAVNSEGEDFNRLDRLAAGESFNADRNLIDQSELKEQLDQIEAVFQTLQQRQKGLISDLLTAKLWEILEEQGIGSAQYSFINDAIVQKSSISGQGITQAEIAKKYGRSEASVSRTLKQFIEKLHK